jgi:hypothetical protein
VGKKHTNKMSEKSIKGIVICKVTGEYIFDLMFESELNPLLLSSYTGALSLFGHDNIGKIDEIIIKGEDIAMIIVNKHKLVLIAILEKNFAANYDFKEEGEKILELFYQNYKDDISSVEVEKFDPFKEILKEKIQDIYNKA